MKVVWRILIMLIAVLVVVGVVVGLSRLGPVAGGPAQFRDQPPLERRQGVEAKNPDELEAPPPALEGQFGGGFRDGFRGGDPSEGFGREGGLFGLLELARNAVVIGVITLVGVLILKAIQARSRKLRQKPQASTS
jgi:hypothetical protein